MIKKILLIEDEPLIQLSLKMLLNRQGIEVDCCSQGNDAIKKIKTVEYQKIICDLMLGDISGFDVIEEAIHFLGREKMEKLFVVITAYNSPQILKKIEQYKLPVLSKPFDDINKAITFFTKSEEL